MGNKPVNFVSFWDAARFTNWLTNGQGNGSTETGAYDLTDSSAVFNNAVTRGSWFDSISGNTSTNTVWVVTSENEWYKAAYYDGSGGYWIYPTQSNTAPVKATANSTGDISNPGTNVANYGSLSNWNGQDENVTSVGSAGAGSASYYGTFDQGGNVMEFNDEILPSRTRGARGGAFYDFGNDRLRSSGRGIIGPTEEGFIPGFRVSRLDPIPTPEAPLLNILGFYESQAGQAVTVDATPTDGYPEVYTYQWYLEDFAIPQNFGGTASSYSITGVESNEGTWWVEVTNTAGTTSATFEYLIFADDDTDGLSNGREVYETLTNPNLADTDGDGLNDGDEVNVHSSDPLDVDSDNDTVADGIEVQYRGYGFDPAVDSTSELTAFQQAASALPGVLTEEQCQAATLGGVALTPDTDNSLSMNFVVEVSDDLEEWTEVDSLSYEVDTSDAKMFMRVRKP